MIVKKPRIPDLRTFSIHSGLLLLLLWGVFFLKFPVLLFQGLLLGVMLMVCIWPRRTRISLPGKLVLANYLFWLIGGLLIGSLTPALLSQPQYYLGEGRIFVCYFPLLVLAIVGARPHHALLAVRHLGYIALAGFLLYVVWSVTGLPFLSGGKAGLFFGTLTSHTGSGTFFAAVMVFLAIYGYETRHRGLILASLLALFPVLGSASRTALVSIAVVLAWFMVRRLSVRNLSICAAVVGIFLFLAPILVPHTFDRTVEVFSRDTTTNIAQTLKIANWQPGEDKEFVGEQHNLMVRMLYWHFALNHFAKSPVIGIGFGRFNDPGLTFRGWPPLVSIGTGGTLSGETLHAHNSYFHLLAECGGVGLLLLLGVWLVLWRDMRRGERLFGHHPPLRAYFLACQGLILFCLVAALFGHALAAPTLGIPALTLLGIASAISRSAVRQSAGSRPPTRQPSSPLAG